MNADDKEALERFHQHATTSGRPVKEVAKSISTTVGSPSSPDLPNDLREFFWQLNEALATKRLNRHQIMHYIRYGEEAPTGNSQAA